MKIFVNKRRKKTMEPEKEKKRGHIFGDPVVILNE
jgi:hypothetical protein